MGNICFKNYTLLEHQVPLHSSDGVTIEVSPQLPDNELEDYYTNSRNHNDTIALAYLFSVI